jgi:hypothetical protein
MFTEDTLTPGDITTYSQSIHAGRQTPIVFPVFQGPQTAFDLAFLILIRPIVRVRSPNPIGETGVSTNRPPSSTLRDSDRGTAILPQPRNSTVICAWRDICERSASLYRIQEGYVQFRPTTVELAYFMPHRDLSSEIAGATSSPC